MRLVLSTNRLNERAGSETYLLTIAASLERLGHDVWLHSIDDADDSTLAAKHGLRYTPAGRGLPDPVDAIVVQDGVVAYTLAERYPGVPQLFVAHSAVHDLQLPPQLPDAVSGVVALNDRVAERMRGLATPRASSCACASRWRSTSSGPQERSRRFRAAYSPSATASPLRAAPRSRRHARSTTSSTWRHAAAATRLRRSPPPTSSSATAAAWSRRWPPAAPRTCTTTSAATAG